MAIVEQARIMLAAPFAVLQLPQEPAGFAIHKRDQIQIAPAHDDIAVGLNETGIGVGIFLARPISPQRIAIEGKMIGHAPFPDNIPRRIHLAQKIIIDAAILVFGTGDAAHHFNVCRRDQLPRQIGRVAVGQPVEIVMLERIDMFPDDIAIPIELQNSPAGRREIRALRGAQRHQEISVGQ